MRRIKVTLELEVNEQAVKDYGLTENTLLNGIVVVDNDDLDGALVTTNIPGLNPASDILLGTCRLVDKSIKSGPVQQDDMQFVRDAIRDDIRTCGEGNYNLTEEEVSALTEEIHPAVEALTQEVYAQVVDGDTDLYDAVSEIMMQFIGDDDDDGYVRLPDYRGKGDWTDTI